ncbi:MAG: response regulator transcription factor [Caldilineaceae bacterium]|nr:response regulator transcription factor [Caldilineaceae bacterium]MCB0145130.1 response regulator transcription factor [Caldilineaceae bacterium]MCB9150376.1 response regulator transcription factor [Caldilineaceae bacterium]
MDSSNEVVSPKILVVEDETAIAETLEYNLTRQGYTVFMSANGFSALQMARQEAPDLVILDIMLPGMDGLEVCRVLRQETNVPILMLTARTEEIDKIVGLEVGADDYLTKPFSMRELQARVKAQLRRVRLIREEIHSAEEPTNDEAPQPKKLTFGNLVIVPDRREALLTGHPVQLKPMEFDLLLYLAHNRNLVLSRDQILEKVWGWDYNGGSRTVDVHIRWLREKIEANPAAPERIITVRGVGYRFEG